MVRERRTRCSAGRNFVRCDCPRRLSQPYTRYRGQDNFFNGRDCRCEGHQSQEQTFRNAYPFKWLPLPHVCCSSISAPMTSRYGRDPQQGLRGGGRTGRILVLVENTPSSFAGRRIVHSIPPASRDPSHAGSWRPFPRVLSPASPYASAELASPSPHPN